MKPDRPCGSNLSGGREGGGRKGKEKNFVFFRFLIIKILKF